MKIKNWVLGIIVLVFIFGGIGIATASGRWQTENTKTPARYATGDFAGESIPADIRGSYTFGDISDAWEIPVDTLAAAFGIDAEYAAAFRCGELESIYAGLPEEVEIGTDAMRIFVSFYTGLPYTSEEVSYLPRAAVDILLLEATLSDLQIAYLETHAVDVEVVEAAVPIDGTVPADETIHTEETAAAYIKGNTTFRELLDWGLTQAEIEQVIGAEMPPAVTGVRDYADTQDQKDDVLSTVVEDMSEFVKEQGGQEQNHRNSPDHVEQERNAGINSTPCSESSFEEFIY